MTPAPEHVLDRSRSGKGASTPATLSIHGVVHRRLAGRRHERRDCAAEHPGVDRQRRGRGRPVGLGLILRQPLTASTSGSAARGISGQMAFA